MKLFLKAVRTKPLLTLHVIDGTHTVEYVLAFPSADLNTLQDYSNWTDFEIYSKMRMVNLSSIFVLRASSN